MLSQRATEDYLDQLDNLKRELLAASQNKRKPLSMLRARIASIEKHLADHGWRPVDEFTMQLAEKYAVCSELLTRGAAREGVKARELKKLRERVDKAMEVLERFPSFGTMAAIEVLREGCS